MECDKSTAHTYIYIYTVYTCVVCVGMYVSKQVCGCVHVCVRVCEYDLELESQ